MELKQGVLGLEDAEFFTSDDIPKARKFELLSARGLIFDGPAELGVAAHDDVRYLGLRVATPDDLSRISTRGKAVLLVSRLESNEHFAGWAFPGEHPRQPIAPKAPPRPVDPEIAEFAHLLEEVGGLSIRVNLLENVKGVPWKPGTLRTWLLLWDERSNPVTTKLVRQKVNDPEVEKFLETQRTERWAERVAPAPGNPLPSYAKHAASPPIPETPGVALAVERVVLDQPGARCVARGSFRLPVLRLERVRPASEGDPELMVGGRRPTGVVTIALVLSGDENADPRLVEVRAPTFDPLPEDQDAPLATGHFAVDVLAESAGIDRQTYAVWAAGGGTLSGPWLTAIVDPALARPPGE